jgi:hypothetical protein
MYIGGRRREGHAEEETCVLFDSGTGEVEGDSPERRRRQGETTSEVSGPSPGDTIPYTDMRGSSEEWSDTSPSSSQSNSNSPPQSDLDLGVSMGDLVTLGISHLEDLVEAYSRGHFFFLLKKSDPKKILFTGSGISFPENGRRQGGSQQTRHDSSSSRMDVTDVDVSDILDLGGPGEIDEDGTTKRSGSDEAGRRSTGTEANIEVRCLDCLKCCVCLEPMGGVSHRKVCLLEPCMHGVCSECALKVSSFNVCPVCKVKTKAIKKTFL